MGARLGDSRGLDSGDLHFSLRACEFGFVASQLGHELGRFDFAERLPQLHFVSFVHGDAFQVARHLRVERCLLVGANAPWQRDVADDLAARWVGNFDFCRLGRIGCRRHKRRGGPKQRQQKQFVGQRKTSNVHKSTLARARNVMATQRIVRVQRNGTNARVFL